MSEAVIFIVFSIFEKRRRKIGVVKLVAVYPGNVLIYDEKQGRWSVGEAWSFHYILIV